MRYRTPNEVRQGIARNPTAAELDGVFRKHSLDAQTQSVFSDIQKSFSAFLSLIESNAYAAARRIIKDPVRLLQKENEIQAEIQALRERPYFPMMRFGRHYVIKYDSANQGCPLRDC